MKGLILRGGRGFKDNRRVVLKDERLKRIRYNFRRIIINSVYDEFEIQGNFANLYGAVLDLTPEEEKELYFLEGTRHELLHALSESICVCSICQKDDRDMVYIKSHYTWYCTKCQDKNYIWNPSIISEEVKPLHNYTSFYKHGGKFPRNRFKKNKE